MNKSVAYIKSKGFLNEFSFIILILGFFVITSSVYSVDQEKTISKDKSTIEECKGEKNEKIAAIKVLAKSLNSRGTDKIGILGSLNDIKPGKKLEPDISSISSKPPKKKTPNNNGKPKKYYHEGKQKK